LNASHDVDEECRRVARRVDRCRPQRACAEWEARREIEPDAAVGRIAGAVHQQAGDTDQVEEPLGVGRVPSRQQDEPSGFSHSELSREPQRVVFGRLPCGRARIRAASRELHRSIDDRISRVTDRTAKDAAHDARPNPGFR
jgi:hypothetical protein